MAFEWTQWEITTLDECRHVGLWALRGTEVHWDHDTGIPHPMLAKGLVCHRSRLSFLSARDRHRSRHRRCHCEQDRKGRPFYRGDFNLIGLQKIHVENTSPQGNKLGHPRRHSKKLKQSRVRGSDERLDPGQSQRSGGGGEKRSSARPFLVTPG